MLGPDVLRMATADGSSPFSVHDSMLAMSIKYLLVDPTVDQARRTTLTVNGGFVARIFNQAALRAKDGGLSLPTADLACASAHLAGAVAELLYISDYADTVCVRVLYGLRV